MKLWIDDVRPAPEGYIWCKSVNESITMITKTEHSGLELIGKMRDADSQGDFKCASKIFVEFMNGTLEVIDIDHDAGDYVSDGGDYIKLLDWLEETGRNYPIHIHSMNPVGVENMRRIIRKNGWREV